MSLIQRLPQYLERNQQTALALHIEHDDGVSWRVSYDALVLETNGVETSITLDGKTIAEVAAEAVAAGYRVPFIGQSTESAALLVPGADALNIGTTQLWRFLNASEREFARAGDQAQRSVQQVYLHQAGGEFLDEHGAYYGFPRTTGEVDTDYRDRIISEILRPKANNRALAMILAQWFGTESRLIDVVDLPLQDYAHGAYLHDGTWDYMDRPARDGSLHTGHSQHYAQFEVVLDVVPDKEVSVARVREVINRYKAAGTYMHSLAAMLRLLSQRGADAVETYLWDVGLSLRSSPGPRDGRYLRGTPGLRYLHDGAYDYDEQPLRDGSRYGASSALQFGPTRETVRYAADLLLSSERSQLIRYNWRARRGQGLTRAHTDAHEVLSRQTDWIMADSARGAFLHDASQAYNDSRHRGMPGLPTVGLDWTVQTLPLNPSIKRPAPGIFRTGNWYYGGTLTDAGDPGGAPTPITPPIEQTHAYPMRLASLRSGLRHDGAQRYGQQVYRGTRAATASQLHSEITVQAQRGSGRTRTPSLQHDGTIARNVGHSRLHQLRYGPVRVVTVS